jgi:hypothetical protein
MCFAAAFVCTFLLLPTLLAWIYISLMCVGLISSDTEMPADNLFGLSESASTAKTDGLMDQDF